MKQFTKLFTALAIALFSFTASAETARIAVAANFAPTAKKISAQFHQQTAHEIKIISGSTGKLLAQIQHGAPFDAFLAADAKSVDKLIALGLAQASTAFVYAHGKLAYWAPKQTPASPNETATPDLSNIKKLALANPKLAPYGQAAKQTLEQLLGTKSHPLKIVQGNNISQTLQFVDSGSVDAGFVALSQLLQIEETQRGYWWQVPTHYHLPLKQKAVLLKHGQTNTAAQAFLTFIQTEKVIAEIELSGYSQ